MLNIDEVAVSLWPPPLLCPPPNVLPTPSPHLTSDDTHEYLLSSHNLKQNLKRRGKHLEAKLYISEMSTFRHDIWYLAPRPVSLQ